MHLIRAIVFLTGAFFAAGCREDDIRTQQVPRSPAAVRTLAVLIPREDATWFLKLSGPAAAVAEDEAAFKVFTESVSFPVGEKPIAWKAPDGWQERPAGSQRFASYRTPAGLEVSVTQLGPEASKVLDNVNRWRRQIRLAPVTEDQLPDMTKSV